MVHQELALVKPFTVAQNIALGLQTSDLSFPLSEVEAKVRELSETYRLSVDPRAKVEDLSAGEQQRADAIRAIWFLSSCPHTLKYGRLDKSKALTDKAGGKRLIEAQL